MKTETKKPENPPAFPLATTADYSYTEDGMSLRDYFAAQAITGRDVTNQRFSAEFIAERAYALADAMLAEREKGGQ